MEVEGFVAGGGDRTDELKSFVGGAVLPAELNVSFPVELTVCTVSSLGDVQAGCPVVVLFRIGTLGSTPRIRERYPVKVQYTCKIPELPFLRGGYAVPAYGDLCI